MKREEYTNELHKILVVEDSLVQAEQVKYIVEKHGFHVIAAKNGLQALKVLNDGYRPFLIISDIMMPEMDGYEFCKRVKEDEYLKEILVILLTSLSDPRDVVKGLECGADGFVTKPYDEDDLLNCIDQISVNQKLRKDSKEQAGIKIFFKGEKHLIRSERQQILNLLLSTYESAIRKNLQLEAVQEELQKLNQQLEKKVEERTANLREEIAERKSAERALEKKDEEIRVMSQQLWQAAKLATMGELASSIAHELNNPLATVSLRIESLLGKMPEDSPYQRELEIIEQEVERMGHLVANLLQFSRRGHPQISTVDLCEEIDKTLELIYYHLRKYKIVVIREFAPDVPQIHADRQHLRQLFLNLFTNASDAMPQGGVLTIRVKRMLGTNQISIEIADTGVGIQPEILPKVTEPFYTTKPEGKGTGLGLAICRRISEGHKGTLEILSDGVPGKGTCVIITLPATNGENTSYLENK